MLSNGPLVRSCSVASEAMAEEAEANKRQRQGGTMPQEMRQQIEKSLVRHSVVSVMCVAACAWTQQAGLHDPRTSSEKLKHTRSRNAGELILYNPAFSQGKIWFTRKRKKFGADKETGYTSSVPTLSAPSQSAPTSGRTDQVFLAMRLP